MIILRVQCFTKHLQRLLLKVSSFQPTTLLRKRLRKRCFAMNFEKILETSSFGRTPLDDCFLCLSANFMNCIISWIQTYLVFAYFLWYVRLLVFGCQKFSLRVLLSICLIFFQFQPVVVYESGPCSEAYCRKAFLLLRVSHNTSIQIELFILPLKKIVEK